MAKLYSSFFFTLFLLSSIFAISRAKLHDPVHTYPIREKKLEILHFYTHDPMSGPNATIWEVARATITAASPTQFGLVSVGDTKMTATPDQNSAELGRAQGLTASADMLVPGIAMYVNVMFTAGKFNGSTLSVLGRNPANSRERELSVVGGTGVFRMAQGYTILTLYSYDPVQNYRIMEHMMHVYYYS